MIFQPRVRTTGKSYSAVIQMVAGRITHKLIIKFRWLHSQNGHQRDPRHPRKTTPYQGQQLHPHPHDHLPDRNLHYKTADTDAPFATATETPVFEESLPDLTPKALCFSALQTATLTISGTPLSGPVVSILWRSRSISRRCCCFELILCWACISTSKHH